MSRRALLLVLLCTVAALPCIPQTTGSDPVGVAILTQALNASGAANPTKPIHDFVAIGTITFFWAGEAVQGPATVKGRGPDQFRLDADLPDSSACVGCPGIRSYAVSHGIGVLKDPDGTLTRLPFHNTVNIGVLSFPYPTMAASLTDPLTLMTYLGTASLNGRAVNRVRVQRRFSSTADPDGALASLCTTDYFLDVQTSLVLKTLDITHPSETLARSYTHEVELDGYSTVNGVQVPRVIREKVDGQTIWQAQLSTISFNVGLTDADFVLR